MLIRYKVKIFIGCVESTQSATGKPVNTQLEKKLNEAINCIIPETIQIVILNPKIITNAFLDIDLHYHKSPPVNKSPLVNNTHP